MKKKEGDKKLTSNPATIPEQPTDPEERIRILQETVRKIAIRIGSQTLANKGWNLKH